MRTQLINTGVGIVLLIALLSLSGCDSLGTTTNTASTNGTSDNSTSSNTTTTTYAPETEPYFKYQWHLDASTYATQNSAFDTGMASANIATATNRVVAGADINVKDAWALTKGSGVIVAVIDDGIDKTHEDLKDSVLYTFNAIDNSTDVGLTSPANSNSTLHGHTCAGFITATVNGKGTTGVAPEAKLIGIKNGTNDSQTIAAFEYAKDKGAKVISCSWGSENISSALEAELQSLYNAGITVLFASGNDGKNLDGTGINDESESIYVIGVGSTGQNNDLASYSNYGGLIDIVAPGGETNDGAGILCLDETGDQGSKDNYGLVTTNYHFGQGTSYATPVAAGVVVLMYAVKPTITPAQVRKILIETTDKVGGSNASYVTNTTTNTTNQTFDTKRAYGKINAYKAVAAAKALN